MNILSLKFSDSVDQIMKEIFLKIRGEILTISLRIRELSKEISQRLMAPTTFSPRPPKKGDEGKGTASTLPC